MTKRQLEDIQLPTEQYDPVTNWMADIPPMTKKPRAFHPRQRGNKINIKKKRHSSKQNQPGQQSHETQASRPLQKNPLDDCLPKGKYFPLKDDRPEIQRLREMLPLDKNPKFVTSLDYSLTTEYNQWRLSELTTIKNVKTNTKMLLPTESLPVIPNFSLVPTLNLWRLRNRNDQDRTYELENKVLKIRVEMPFEQITAFPSNDSPQPETISTDLLIVENSHFWRQLWDSESSIADLQSKLDRLTISKQTACLEKEELRKQLVVSSQTLKIRDRQQQELLKKASQFIKSNQLLGLHLRELKDKHRVLLAKLDNQNN